MPDEKPELSMILKRDDGGTFRLWACRGQGKGCSRNRYRAQKTPCEDCVGPLDKELTLGEVQELLAKGDA